ncbi:Fe-S cluster assembly protein DRE2 [Escovopsis weberi]|uniref:Fe-S cluster assembly protein DRE2 n=1 Tax=Escovopsis weberi TaxID=150374 RepID=A0A0M9VUS6_ESCWE|nr:Fe-S cluster assembly protein DRE2 [Escovopsis weberi]
MAPSIVTIDPNDHDVTPAPTPAAQRTLLLAPPSLASHPSALTTVLSQHDRHDTDLQMIDRLAAGLIHLPPSSYDLVLLLADPASSLDEPVALLTRSVLARVADALKPSGRLRAHDGSADLSNAAPALTKEAVLAGLIASPGGFDKPNYDGEGAVSLRLVSKRKDKDKSEPSSTTTTTTTTATASATPAPAKPAVPAGVVLVDFSDDLGADGDDDEDLIDEDTLLTEEDLKRPINIPPECQPKAGKRRRACKDCTCGLADRLAAEDAAQRAQTEKQLQSLRLAADDLAEIDFTVQGKVGSCGNCALGDAFRCDGCPYIGLPPFKPGEEVRLLNNEVQL